MGDIAASWVLQVGNQSHPRLRSPLLDRIAGVVESKKCFESFRIIYISKSRISFYFSAPFVALVRTLDVDVLSFLSSIFHKKKFRITRVSWDRSDILMMRTLFLVPPDI